MMVVAWCWKSYSGEGSLSKLWWMMARHLINAWIFLVA